jgi:CDP-diglyceride synthetase
MMFLFLIIVEVFKTVKHFEAIGTWLLSIVYISTPFGLLSLMGSEKFISHFEANYAIIVMALVWVSDTFAYFGGERSEGISWLKESAPRKPGGFYNRFSVYNNCRDSFQADLLQSVYIR